MDKDMKELVERLRAPSYTADDYQDMNSAAFEIEYLASRPAADESAKPVAWRYRRFSPFQHNEDGSPAQSETWEFIRSPSQLDGFSASFGAVTEPLYAVPQPSLTAAPVASKDAMTLLRKLDACVDLDKLICYASTATEYEQNAIVRDIRVLLADQRDASNAEEKS